MRKAFIYLVTCVPNGKVYVGKTVQKVSRRWKRHILDSNKIDLRFYRAIKKYGPESFRIDTMEITTEDAANEKEILWIAVFGSKNPDLGYNDTSGGEGFPHTDEQKQKISEKCRLWWADPDNKEKMSEAHKGKHMGSANPAFGKTIWLGRKHSEESKRKMSETRKKKFEDPEFKAQMTAANVGKHHTEEGRKNISAAQKGRPNRRPNYRPTEATKLKTAESMRKRWEEKKSLPI